jgi:hypothetical protein
MIKVLYVPTGNTFVLPDDEVMKLIASARGSYQILEGGLQKIEEGKLEPETVKELVMKKEEPEKEEEQPKEEEFDYMSLTKDELMIYARKLGIACNRNNKLETIQEKVAEKLGK